MMTEHWMPSQLYCARRISAGGVRHVDDWRIKTYRISYDGREANADHFAPAWTLARAVLPEPARTSARPGLGFVIEHRGRGIDYFVLGWWDRENELPIRIWVREHNAQAVWRAARESESVCVWDLQVLSFERDAFVNTLLAGRADAESAYLDQHLHVNPL